MEKRAISISAEDTKYLREVANRYGLAGVSAAIRYIINVFRKQEKKEVK